MDFEKLAAAMSELDEDTVMEMVEEAAKSEETANAAMQAMQKGMETVGDLFASGEYFVSDLIYAGEVITDAMNILKGAIAKKGDAKLGKLILCTVKDDLHDIGKNIVRAVLEAGGFEVLDLGVDVAPETIVETAKKENIKIIALSGILVLALDSMKATAEAFEKAGMRDQVKIIVGGATVTETSFASTGADAWAFAPQQTLDICKGWAQN